MLWGSPKKNYVRPIFFHPFFLGVGGVRGRKADQLWHGFSIVLGIEK
jgi:hypothetical protein